MSYILDALKKSDEARQRRRPLRLPVEPAPEPKKPKRRLRWQAVAAFALVLNACLLVWLASSWLSGGGGGEQRGSPPGQQPLQIAAQTGQGPPAAPGENVQSPARQEPEEQTQTQKDRKMQAALQAPVERVKKGEGSASAIKQPGAGARGVPPQRPPAAPPAEASPKAPSAVQATPSPAASPKPAPDLTPSAGEARPAPAVPPKPVPAQSPPAPASTPSATAGAGSPPSAGPQSQPPGAVRPLEPPGTAGAEKQKKLAAKPPATGETAKKPDAAPAQPGQASGGKELLSDLKTLTEGVETPSAKAAVSKQALKFHELPSSVRDSVPKMSVSMLVYSKTPDERWVNINGSKMREGQEVAAGLKVEEITPDGAILSFKGQRFYKGVLGD